MYAFIVNAPLVFAINEPSDWGRRLRMHVSAIALLAIDEREGGGAHSYSLL